MYERSVSLQRHLKPHCTGASKGFKSFLRVTVETSLLGGIASGHRPKRWENTMRFPACREKTCHPAKGGRQSFFVILSPDASGRRISTSA